MLNYDNNSVTSASIKAHTQLDMVQYSVAMHAPMYLHQHHKFYIQLSLIFLQLRTLVVVPLIFDGTFKFHKPFHSFFLESSFEHIALPSK